MSSAGRVDDGYSTTITVEDNPNIKFWEKTVTPPSLSGGGAIETTTMRNANMRTKHPKSLITVGDITLTVAYNPAVYDEIVTLINQRKLFTVNFADGSSLPLYGWIDEFTPGECAEGEQPTADLTIIITSEDDNFEEYIPNHIAAA